MSRPNAIKIDEKPDQRHANRTRERMMAAARREFAVLLRSIGKGLLLIVAVRCS
jgi:hypothetical protein